MTGFEDAKDGPNATGERDYVAEMRRIIDLNIENIERPFTNTEVAHRIVVDLAVRDKDLLHGWLTTTAMRHLATAVRSRLASKRALIVTDEQPGKPGVRSSQERHFEAMAWAEIADMRDEFQHIVATLEEEIATVDRIAALQHFSPESETVGEAAERLGIPLSELIDPEANS